MMIEEVWFPSSEPNPVTLFGRLHHFGGGERRPAAIVCHPSSHGECNLDHPFVEKVCELLNESGFITLRFNFRGNAPSRGTLMQGRAELHDVQGAIDVISRREDVDGDALYCIGHSFGAAMSLNALMADDRVHGAVASGLPVKTISSAEAMYFEHYAFDASGLRNCAKPRLFVRATADHLCGEDSLNAFVAQLPEPKSVVEIPEADHFFRRTGRRGISAEMVQQAAEAIRGVVVGWPKKR